ncbi:hypothetical protein DEI81_06290 [Curtobacterium sp. MCBD17_013]|uniref:baeRF2 domain-containing protein n=1 Tax=Curtobacterium sp. MCBD17_013 TaxID=2175668 RepID=UPI000DA9F617|nr:Vms1/Ankzf1 family peptidyl-tRNA hydrolase [Curtobacterium sp. MCBD17_013]PZF63706.1 hypothetical protein DEI81_06290 [Curtobacterium sp. MCBD17_013]
MAPTTAEQVSEEHRGLAALLAQPGTWSWAYVDVSGDREDPQHLAALQVRAARDQLMAQGAPSADVEAIERELGEAPGVPAPVARFVLARDGELVVSEVLPGHMHGPESVGYGAVPDLVPLLAHRPLDVPFLVVEVGREGGGYRAYRLGHAEPSGQQEEEYVAGRTDTLHKFQGGGWAHLRWQHHTEEIWRENEAQVVEAVEQAVDRLRPRLVVVAGDIRARQLFIDQLSTATRPLVSEVPVDTRAPDASENALVEHVEIALARVVAQRRHDVEDLLRTHVGRGDREAVTGVGPVVSALQQAQASIVVVDPAAFEDRTVLALDAAPWIATAPEEALGTTVLGSVPAAVGITRAALVTDAEVVLVNAASVPSGAPVAALLRWHVGPDVPGAGPAAGATGRGEGPDRG